ncbi:MAG: DUF378 domain-containing protein [candidate division Zixibacteria bacterium]|nr:DUF378 domain-containing protein [candidate division Zixibacteria bacterium]
MKALDVVFLILLVVGGLNWGLVGIFKFDLVAWIFGDMSVISRIVYIIVAVSALYNLVLWKSIQHRWGRGHVPATA